MSLFKKLWLLALAPVLLVILSFTLIAVQQQNLDQHRVSEQDARIVAERFVLDLSWEGEIILQEQLYNLNNKVQAYLFTQWNDGNYERYIIVSALKNTSPVLEFSENEPPVKANLNDKGFYFIPNVVYDKSRAAIMAKRWFFTPLMLPHFLEFNINKKVEENKSSWSYYFDDNDSMLQ